MSAIKISDKATKADIAAWAREQFAKNGQPMDDRASGHEDVVISALCLVLVKSGNVESIATAMRVAARVGTPDLAAAMLRFVDGMRAAA